MYLRADVPIRKINLPYELKSLSKLHKFYNKLIFFLGLTIVTTCQYYFLSDP